MIISLNKNDIESVKYAANEVAKVIKDGGVVISPTDTVYGMLASAFNPKAVQRIYEIKGREKDKPLLILLESEKDLKLFSDMPIPEIVKKNIPGELTFIMPLSANLKYNFEFLKTTVAIRIPKDNYMKLILKKTPPIVAPSANLSGEGIIYEGDKIVEIFKDKADLIINAGLIEKKLPSTLYDSINKKILRQGEVYLKE